MLSVLVVSSLIGTQPINAKNAPSKKQAIAAGEPAETIETDIKKIVSDLKVVPNQTGQPLAQGMQECSKWFEQVIIQDTQGNLIDTLSDWETKIVSQDVFGVIDQTIDRVVLTIEPQLIATIPQTAENIQWNSKYYQFSADPKQGSRNVCDKNNNVAWPYSSCDSLSSIGKWNKMICSSYGSSRFWEVNYPNEPYPLERTWVLDLVNPSTTHSGRFQISHRIQDIRSKTLLCIGIPGGNHIAFIESVDADGHVVITEANVRRGESEYGWYRWEGNSVEEYIRSLNGSFKGYLFPEEV